LPKPVQQPHPPIIVGGAGKKRTPALSAKYAAEFNAGFSSVEETAARFVRVREACEAIGRDPETLMLSTAHTVVVGKDDAEVKRRAAVIGRDPENPGDGSIIGTPAEVVDHLGRLAAAGSHRQYVQILDLTDLDHLDLIASEVLPQLH
jgi:alkanesulfonate monooxygenase SsuD/methylene tetrahydromethanopterin reductase-like flavin-dependent oxidoreductase (luciferase family)